MQDGALPARRAKPLPVAAADSSLTRCARQDRQEQVAKGEAGVPQGASHNDNGA
jgi:hypothetical protein